MQVKAPHKIGGYTLRGTVGDGAFSVVKLAYNDELGQYFACKIVPKSRLSSHNLEQRFELEIRINQQMHHSGIVGLIDILKDELNYYVIMEFCPNGELFQYIVDRGKLSEEDAKPKIMQILQTLQYIHSMNVTHRDLKPENILIDQYGQLKISDFGLSRFLDASGLANTPCGSPCYASPECISGHPYDGRTTDVWSCGVILYAMVTGQLPWTKRNQTQLFEQIRKGEYTIPDHVSLQCASFIRGLMTVDKDKRLTIEQALAHPWLAAVPTFIFQKSSQQSCVSLKKVDEFFNKDQPSDGDVETKLVRTNSQDMKTFDKSLKQIKKIDPPTEAAPIKMKRKIVGIKQPEGSDKKSPRAARISSAAARKSSTQKVANPDPIIKHSVAEPPGVEVRHRRVKTPTTVRSVVEGKQSAAHKITKPKPIAHANQI